MAGKPKCLETGDDLRESIQRLDRVSAHCAPAGRSSGAEAGAGRW
jgi:hypothetical protein